MTAPDTTPRKNTLGAIAAGAGFGIAVVSAVAALLAGLGTRWGWWDFRTGFMILRFAVWAGLAAAAISLYAMFAAWRHGYRRAMSSARSNAARGGIGKTSGASPG